MSKAQDFEALAALLPFYANGSLSEVDRARVEQGLRAHPALKAALQNEIALAQRIKTAGDDMMAGPDNQEERLQRIMDKLPDRETNFITPIASPAMSGALAFLNPKYWVPAIGLSLCAAVALQASLISTKNAQINQLEEKFQSAGGPCEDKAQDGRIILELKDNAPWSAVADLLDTQQLRIVDSGGFGTLTVASKAEPDALAAQVAKLKASPLVQNADIAK